MTLALVLDLVIVATLGLERVFFIHICGLPNTQHLLGHVLKVLQGESNVLVSTSMYACSRC